MASEKLTGKEKSIIGEALEVYRGEIKKLFKKAEKLNLDEQSSLKGKMLDAAALQSKVTGEDIAIEDDE